MQSGIDFPEQARRSLVLLHPEHILSRQIMKLLNFHELATGILNVGRMTDERQVASIQFACFVIGDAVVDRREANDQDLIIRP